MYIDTQTTVESPNLYYTHNIVSFCPIHRKSIFCLSLTVYSHTRMLVVHCNPHVWFHLDARVVFVSIIAIQLEEADLLRLVVTVMLLCLGIKKLQHSLDVCHVTPPQVYEHYDSYNTWDLDYPAFPNFQKDK